MALHGDDGTNEPACIMVLMRSDGWTSDLSDGQWWSVIVFKNQELTKSFRRIKAGFQMSGGASFSSEIQFYSTKP